MKEASEILLVELNPKWKATWKDAETFAGKFQRVPWKCGRIMSVGMVTENSIMEN